MTLEFELTPHVLNSFPEARVSALRVKGLKAFALAPQGVELVAKAAQIVAQTFASTEDLVADPRIEAWRKAYSAIGAKPSKFRSSIEALARRAIKGAPLSIGIPAVDIYNSASLETLSPLGAYDCAHLPSGKLVMRLADPSQDTFNPLGGTAADFPLHKELVVYATGEKILCWGFNCRDSQETCLSETTDEAIFFGEAAFATHHQSLQNAMGKLQVLFKGMGTECGSIETADILKPTFNV